MPAETNNTMPRGPSPSQVRPGSGIGAPAVPSSSTTRELAPAEQRERVRGGIEAEKERIVEDLRRRSDGSASGQKPESPRSAKPTGRAATERVAGDGSGSTGLAMAATMPIAVGREVTTDPIAAAPVVVQPVVGGSVPMGMPIS